MGSAATATRPPWSTRFLLRLGAGCSSRTASHRSSTRGHKTPTSRMRAVPAWSGVPQPKINRGRNARGHALRVACARQRRRAHSRVHKEPTVRSAARRRSRAPPVDSRPPTASPRPMNASSARLATRVCWVRPHQSCALPEGTVRRPGRRRENARDRASPATFASRAAPATHQAFAPRAPTTTSQVARASKRAQNAIQGTTPAEARRYAPSVPKITIAPPLHLPSTSAPRAAASAASPARRTPR
mmetsp:Transcript_73350/g.201433  ORF Transcript_73350/g.201433 Transcript_73350/m.201433 type:complete len:244 (-) Transcript_73350:238-969(-)